MGGWSVPLTTQKPSTDLEKPLSSLLPSPPTPYSNVTKPGVSSGSKLQYEADILGTEGTKTLESGIGLLGKPLDYWQNVLKPPTRTGLLEEAAPVVSSIVSQYSTGKKAVSQQARGGGTAATLANLPFMEAGDITGLLERQLAQKLNVLQPGAAQAITGIAQSLAGMGLQELGLSSQDIATLISADLLKGEQKQKSLGMLGKGIGILAGAMITAATGGAAGPALIAGSASS